MSLFPQAAVSVPVRPPPVDPRLRLLLIAVRRALIILADGIADYLDIEKRV